MQTTENLPIYDSNRTVSPEIDEARELFRYRNLVFQMVRRDLVARYKRSVLGVAWTMLNPLGTMIILSIVFSQVFNTDHKFPAYLLSGQLAWIFFSQTTSDGMASLITGVSMLQRMYMPRTIFTVTAVGNGLVNLIISIVPLLIVMMVVQVPIRPALLFLPVPIILLACFSLGVGLFLSTIAVYFRDVVAMYQVLLTAWMYLTPIIYPEELLNPTFRFWVATLNPMYGLIKLFRIPLYEGRMPLWGELWPAALTSFIVLGIGWFVFTRKSHEFTYRI